MNLTHTKITEQFHITNSSEYLQIHSGLRNVFSIKGRKNSDDLAQIKYWCLLNTKKPVTLCFLGGQFINLSFFDKEEEIIFLLKFGDRIE